MPLYEYQCHSCQQRFEQIRKFSDPPLTVCPHCGAGSLEKLISSPAIQFKGSGFYITDYAKSGAGEKGAGKEGSSADSATDKAKPAASAEKSSDAGKADSGGSSTTAPTATATKAD
jgi:putative FmdB family regulatory protein